MKVDALKRDKNREEEDKLIKDKVGCKLDVFSGKLNCQAIQMKVELYTSEHHWKMSDTSVNRLLLNFMHYIEHKFNSKVLREWCIDMQGLGQRPALSKVELNYTITQRVKVPKVPLPLFTFKKDKLAQIVKKKHPLSSKKIHKVLMDQTKPQKDSGLPLMIMNTKDYFAFDLHVVTEDMFD